MTNLFMVFFCYLVWCSSWLSAYDRTLDICAIFKNEARFLAEWIDYHRLVGVQEFWLYNNNSDDDYLEVLKPYINQGTVHLIEWPSVQEENDWKNYSFTVQTGAYSHCLNHVRGQCKWLAIIDLDEFIVPVCADDIPSILEMYFPDVSGICINWLIFGTSFVEEVKQDELMIEKLTRRAPLDHHRNLIYKSIVQPSHVSTCSNPHFCLFLPHHWHVNTNREKVGDVAGHSVLVDKLKIYHYWSKDEKFFREQKIPRYLKWGSKLEDISLEKEVHNSVEDLEMHRFIDRLRRLRNPNLSVD